jgi:hypothetical protein
MSDADTSVTHLSKKQRLEAASLGGNPTPTSHADCTPPAADTADTMLVVRDFLYAMPCALAEGGAAAGDGAGPPKCRTCIFPPSKVPIPEDNGASDGEASEGDDPMDVDATLQTSDEATLFRMAKHLLFACGDVSKETFMYVFLFVVGSFGRHCRDMNCSRAGECTLRTLPDADRIFNKEEAAAYAERVLGLNTPLAYAAKMILAMRCDAIRGNARPTFQAVSLAHRATLSMLVYQQSYSTSIVTKGFELFKPFISVRNRHHQIIPPDWKKIMGTFDGTTKTYLLSNLTDDTELLKSNMASMYYKELLIKEVCGMEKAGAGAAKNKAAAKAAKKKAAAKAAKKKAAAKVAKKKAVAKVAKKKAAAKAAKNKKKASSDSDDDDESDSDSDDDDEADSDSDDDDADDDAADDDDACADDDAPNMFLRDVITGFDPSGTGVIKAVALAEMEAKPTDTTDTYRPGRILIECGRHELKLKLNPQGENAKRFLPEVTLNRFSQLALDPAPPGGVMQYAGGGEPAALKFIAQLKRYGEVALGPRYQQPSELLKAMTLPEVDKLSTNAPFNTFWGFHADHAYAAFHPADLQCRGIFEPDMKNPEELVTLASWGRMTAAADMFHPTTAIWFRTESATLTPDTYVDTARDLKTRCMKLPVYLTNAAKWHTKHAAVTNLDNLLTRPKYFDDVASIVRDTRTIAELCDKISKAFPDRQTANNKRAAATMAFLAAGVLHESLDIIPQLFSEFVAWRATSSTKRPQAFLDTASGAEQRRRRSATLILCGYLFFPDSDDLGLMDVFQLEGECIRFGELDVQPITEAVKHAAVTVGNDLETGVFGYKVCGHSARTLREAHRIILLNAVRECVDKNARWATQEEVPVAARFPSLQTFTVAGIGQNAVRLRDEKDGKTHVVHMAVHPMANGYTVVPPVFSRAGEVLFERNTRLSRGAAGTAGELHGAQLLKKDDEVSVWTTPVDGDPAKKALIAVLCYTMDDTPLWPAFSRDAAFNIVATGTPDQPTRLEVFDASLAFAAVHRQPTTVAHYLYSPTKTGDKEIQGQGVGKSKFMEYNCSVFGPNLVDTVTDYETFVSKDKFTSKGFGKLYTTVDDVNDPRLLLTSKFKAETTARTKEIQVKNVSNAVAENFGSYILTGQYHMTSDEVEHEAMTGERRPVPTFCKQTMAGDAAYFAYHYGMYWGLTPLIQKCVLEHLRAYPGVETRTSMDLQLMAKKSDTAWIGQVPMLIGFMQALYKAPRLDEKEMFAAKEAAALLGKFTLLQGICSDWKYVSEGAFFDAAVAYSGQVLQGSSGMNRGKLADRNRQNANIIVRHIVQAADESTIEEWEEMKKKTKPDEKKNASETTCFAVSQKLLRDAIVQAGYTVFEREPEEAPSWPPK